MQYTIPLLDLQQQYQQIGAELETAVLSVLRSGNYILGQCCSQLEAEIATLCNCKYGVGVANGTDALFLALWGLDIGPGDEVITTPFTFAATVEAIMLRGAIPVFVDIDSNTFNIDSSKVEKVISSRTKALMPVHLYGQPADMDVLIALAKRYSLKVIEDNAQAISATYKGSPTGSFGDAACISFYPTKNLGACGDAGMIVTNDEPLAEKLRAIRAHGMQKRYFHDELGVNSRLSEIQAATLLSKLKYLKDWNNKRQQIAKLYTTLLANCAGIVTPIEKVYSDSGTESDGALKHVWHQYTIRVSGSGEANFTENMRDYVIKELAKHGIASTCYYPVPLHLQKAFTALGYSYGDFPIAEKLAQEVLSLPIYPELSEAQVHLVADTLKAILSEVQTVVPVTSIARAQAAFRG